MKILVVFDTMPDVVTLHEGAKFVVKYKQCEGFDNNLVLRFTLEELEIIVDKMLPKAEEWAKEIPVQKELYVPLDEYNIWNRLVFMCKKMLGEIEIEVKS